MRKIFGGALAFAALLITAPAAAQAVDTSKCATVTVTKTTDIAALQRDADCFGAAAAADTAQVAALQKAASAAKASQKYRLDRIAELKTPPAPEPNIVSADDTSVDEGAGTVTVHVRRTGSTAGITFFDWATSDGTAKAGMNYTASKGSVHFAVGQSDYPISIPILRDHMVMDDVKFNVTLYVGQGGKLGKNATVTVKNIDAPSPASSGYIPSPSLAGLPDAPFKDFDPKTAVAPAGIPPVMTGDSVGAFRFTCAPGQLLYDDPIVYPGQPGRSHLHQFYGNLSANANSTFESLGDPSDSTCNWSGKPDGSGGKKIALNRSAYWMPAMLDGLGNAIKPQYVSIYYKRLPLNSTECKDSRATKGCLPIPSGLRFIMGRDMLNLAGPRTGNFHFSCAASNGGDIPGGGGPDGTGFKDMAGAAAMCKPGQLILASIGAPGCWDGKNLDTPNHRDHIGFATYNGQLPYPVCPAATPYIIPTFTLTAAYEIHEGEDPTKWRLSSDAMAPNEPAGSTFHADYFERWHPITKITWTDKCINGFLSSTMGNLCDGTILPGASWGSQPFLPRLVPLSSIPTK